MSQYENTHTQTGAFVLCETRLQILKDLYHTWICASSLKQYEYYRYIVFIGLQTETFYFCNRKTGIQSQRKHYFRI